MTGAIAEKSQRARLVDCSFHLAGTNEAFLRGQWRDGRVVEGARLESVYRGNSIEGSNPSLSAISLSFGLPVRSIGILPIASEFAMSAILTTHAPHFAAGESTGSRKGELMAGRGSQTLKKRQKEQQRKDRKQLKIEKRLQRRKER